MEFKTPLDEFEWTSILVIGLFTVAFSSFSRVYFCDSIHYPNLTWEREDQDISSSSHSKFLTEKHLEPIALRQWKTVLSWIVFNTDEVGSLRDKKGQTILHHASLFRAPVDIIESILWAAPELASVKNRDGEVALHWAVRLSSSNHIMNVLLEADPESAFISDHEESTPLSLMWDRWQSTLFENWRYDRQSFVEKCNLWKSVLSIFQAVDKAHNPKHPELFLPLHIAACRCTPPGLFSFMIEIYKYQLSVEDSNGVTPLLLTCQSPSANRSPDLLTKIQLILRENPSQAMQKDFTSHGRYPIHVGLDSGISLYEGVETLIRIFPSSLAVRDPESGLFPFALAATPRKSSKNPLSNNEDVMNHNLTTIYWLLREDPSVIKMA